MSKAPYPTPTEGLDLNMDELRAAMSENAEDEWEQYKAVIKFLKPIIATQTKAAYEAGRRETDGCPCLLVEPCRPSCSCASPTLSGGCDRCAKYGSLEQRKAAAERLAKLKEKPNGK